MKPGPRAVQGAARGMVAAAGLFYLIYAAFIAQGPLLPGLVVFLILVILGLLLLWLGQGVAWLIGLLAKIPWPLRWALPAAVGLLFVANVSTPESAGPFVVAVLLIGGLLVGAAVASITRGGWAVHTRLQRGVSAAALGLGVVILVGGAAWYAWRGTPPVENPNAARLSGQPQVRVTQPDPSQPGSFPVKTLTYGAGTDRFRPEFAEEADLRARTVDGSRFLFGSWQGFPGQMRELWWGITPQTLPLNGRVWYPEGDGPFPLVLVVHGNHNMSDFSDPGYDYLGELLASRGFILVSVDENFLNGGFVDGFENFSGENDARGWLLLEHIAQWQRWNRAPESPFYGKVDMDNIAVMGHSRGGEAAAVAAAFNRLPHYPDAGEQVFTYNFNIRAVVAIAPIDGQYVPAWKPVQLNNVNYLILHGSHDSDVSSFDGINLYERMKFTDGQDWFKAALFIHRANHGQFNTTWGDSDSGALAGGFLNRGALLSKAEQEQIAKVYISAFLEAALHGQDGYLPLLADSRAAGEGWLPDVIYINRYDRAGDVLVAAFEEDVDLNTGTLPGVTTSALNFNHWREQKVHSKWSGQDNTGVYLKWNENGTGAYTVTLPDAGFDAPANGTLIFALADANQDPPPAEYGEGEKNEATSAPAVRQPVDLSIIVEDAQGQSAVLPLSQYALLQPQIRVKLYKDNLFKQNDLGSEPVLRSYSIPLADFAAANPEFDPAQVRAIEFLFDRTPRGSVILDAVGFRE